MDNVAQITRIPHSRIEDTLAILLGTLIVSFGVLLLKQVGALTGSSAGIAFLISYITPLSFSSTFFFINLPFYWLALQRMGWEFTLKTFCTVGLVCIFTHIHSMFMHFTILNVFYATLFGNIIIGIGFIILFRHKASLGGINVLGFWLQNRIGLSVGKLQMVVDVCILMASLFVVPIPMLFASILGSSILNLIIIVNHRPDRYIV